MPPKRPESKTTSFFNVKSQPDPGFYSHAASINGSKRLIFTSGHLGTQSDGKFPTEYSQEVKQAYQNLREALSTAGAQVRDIVKLTFYCVGWNFENVGEWLEPTSAFMIDNLGTTIRPLTTLVPVTHLAIPGARFEVEAVAAVGGSGEFWTSPELSLGSESILPPIKVDVVVIGGGFSGLQAARDVHAAGLSCIVLEAKHRIGGRSHSHKLTSGPGIVELGATWINKTTQPKAYALTQKYNLQCAQQYDTGISILQTSDGSVLRSEGGFAQPADLPETALLEFVGKLDAAAAAVDLHNHAAGLGEADLSVEKWIVKQNLHDFVADFMRHFVRALVGRESKEVGLHYILDYIKSGGGFFSLASEGDFGAQSLKIKEGTSSIAHGLASELPLGSVYLNSPVTTVSQSASGCEISTANGLVLSCSKAIIAIPTNTYEDIKFTPPLSRSKRAITSRTKPGVYAKAVLTYKQAWWREIGLQGSFSSFVGPICFSWETSDAETQQYSLALFVAGDKAASWHKLSSQHREEAILDHLAQLVGAEHAALVEKDLLEVNIMEWTKEDFIGGAPTSAMGPGELAEYGAALRAPFGALHFAGGETAYEWKGYLEGALLAGSRAAAEVVGSTKHKL